MSEQSLLLFHHPSSEPCQKLIKLIPKDKKVQYVDISQVQQLPKEVVSVPCLVVNGNEILLGKKAFDFFKEEDSIGSIDFGSKNSFVFSNIDEDNTDGSRNNGFSDINDKSMEFGVPEYKDSKDNNNGMLDMEQLQAQRAAEIPQPVKKQ